MHRVIATVALIAALAGPAFAAELPWRDSVDAALAASTESGRPVLVALFIPYAERDVERQDPALLAEDLRPRLGDFELARANLFAHPEWRRGNIWKMPRYVFLRADGVVVHDHRKAISGDALDAFADSRDELTKLEERVAHGDPFNAQRALARWHSEHLNGQLAATGFRAALAATESTERSLPLLMELSKVCVRRGSPWQDEETARWALARIAELDPDDAVGYESQAALRGIEVTVEVGRLGEAVEQAAAFLAARPKHALAGDVLTRQIYALTRQGDYAAAYAVLAKRSAYRLDAPTEKRLLKTTQAVFRQAMLRRQADAEPPSMDACIALLQSVHDNPPIGFMERYLRRALLDESAEGVKLRGARFELANQLSSGDAAARAEAAALLDLVVAEGDELPEREQREVARLRKRLGVGGDE